MAAKKLLFVAGTRPEVLKLAPVIIRAKSDKRFKVSVCLTAQHREMSDEALKIFRIRPSFDLNLMKANQTLEMITSGTLLGMQNVITQSKPDAVIVQGDTTSAWAAALAAFYQKIKVAHIEAGLRSYDPQNPYPEEMNRSLISRIAYWHFAPTKNSRDNLLSEGICANQIWVTGNTIVDALNLIKPKLSAHKTDRLPAKLLNGRKLVFVTAHRRESFGKPLISICQAISELSKRFSDLLFVLPMHPNPSVQTIVHRELGSEPGVKLINPVPYIDCLKLISQAHLILTDSGGIQEEAPSFKKPVLVLRHKTERPEGIQAGIAKLVGTSKTDIITAVSKLMTEPNFFKRMSLKTNPYGNGRASEKILNILAGNH